MRILGIDLDLLTPAERRDLANALLRAACSKSRVPAAIPSVFARFRAGLGLRGGLEVPMHKAGSGRTSICTELAIRSHCRSRSPSASRAILPAWANQGRHRRMARCANVPQTQTRPLRPGSPRADLETERRARGERRHRWGREPAP
jgi:hypothetical protein